MHTINNFTVFESVWGRFVVNRHCAFQAEALAKTGRPHIQAELDRMMAVVESLPPQAICIDAGANIGLVAVPLAQVLRPSGGKVLAFEVQRMIFYALCGAAALNDLDNLLVFNAGLGEAAGELSIGPPDYGAAQDFGTFSLVKPETQGHGAAEEAVSITTIDALDLPRLDFLKIDVEGMELPVLAGGRETIAKHRPWCWVEYWMTGADKIKQAFEPYGGYDIYVMDDLNLLCAPREKQEASGLEIQAQTV